MIWKPSGANHGSFFIFFVFRFFLYKPGAGMVKFLISCILEKKVDLISYLKYYPF